jgi:NAD(P)H dehydrogenase (quinone)
MAKVMIIYYSGTGNTKSMAEAVAEGAESVIGPGVIVKAAQDASVDDMVSADAIAIGTPDHFSYMNGYLKLLFDKGWLRRKELYGKVWAAFSSGGVDGVKSRESIEWVADHFKVKKIITGVSCAGKPTPEILDGCRKMGVSMVQALSQ